MRPPKLRAYLVVEAALIFVIGGCGGSDSTVTRTSGDAPAAPPVLQLSSDATLRREDFVTPEREQWRQGILKTPRPKPTGCFHASYPDTDWTETSCVTVPPKPQRHAGPRPETVGVNVDFELSSSSSPITAAEGSFPSVHGVRETDSFGFTDIYSLQLNTNRFASPAACRGATDPRCVAWQQFIYSDGTGTDDLAGFGTVYMQYWLINYGAACPSGYFASGGDDCFTNSDATGVDTAYPVSDLPRMTFTATAGAQDTVAISTENGVWMRSNGSVLGLGTANPRPWNSAEFNIFGDGEGTQAVFDGGAIVTVRTAVTNQTRSSPSFVRESETGETNNLTLVPNSACPIGGTSLTDLNHSPAIQFVETNASGVTAPFCLVRDITPIVTLAR